ncbi:hypothetical protein FOZ63_031580 [Perkinsus olseni]|uniref:Uncharacterized protein n=1 Tax=Perkinsus olseni TaxID=32597 RepID=A0A7J6UBM5_PEROL|nr:hypothetical protein FOZ63_031580 [Perkinsus olseni]
MISYTFKGNDSIITDAVKRLIDNGKLRRDDCPGDWEADRVEVAKMIIKETERARNLSAHGTNDENDIIHDLFSKVENGIAVDINFSLSSISAVEKFRRFVSQLENETKDFAEDRPRPNTNSRSDSVSEDNGGREESSDTEIEDQRCNKNAESEPERIPLTGKRKHAQDYALLLSMPHYYSQCFRQGTTADTHRWQEKMPPDTNNEACCDI